MFRYIVLACAKLINTTLRRETTAFVQLRNVKLQKVMPDKDSSTTLTQKAANTQHLFQQQRLRKQQAHQQQKEYLWKEQDVKIRKKTYYINATQLIFIILGSSFAYYQYVYKAREDEVKLWEKNFVACIEKLRANRLNFMQLEIAHPRIWLVHVEADKFVTLTEILKNIEGDWADIVKRRPTKEKFKKDFFYGLPCYYSMLH